MGHWYLDDLPEAVLIRLAKLSTHHKYFKWIFIGAQVGGALPWIRDRLWVYDTDNCGSHVDVWAVIEDKPRFYRIEHSWYWHDYGGKEAEVLNEYEVTEVDRASLESDHSSQNKDVRENLRFVI